MSRICSILSQGVVFIFIAVSAIAQDEQPVTGFMVSQDMDHYADFARTGLMANRNYNYALGITLFGEEMNSSYLGLPYVRAAIDNFIITPFLEETGFRLDKKKHAFSFLVTGYTASFISDITDSYLFERTQGYTFANDRPFSSFTGFRSSRRLEGNKLYSKSARQVYIAVNSSFSFGIAGSGLVDKIQRFYYSRDAFGTSRPEPTLWKRDQSKDYPTGEVMPAGIPLPLYSLSSDIVLARFLRLFQFQFRPEINLGYYTNLGIGFDFGKRMQGDKFLDVIGYTDASRVPVMSVAKKNVALTFLVGGTARLVLYNAHLSGVQDWSDRNFLAFGDIRKVVMEGYLGGKLQLLRRLEFMAAVNVRTAEFNNPQHPYHFWATATMKVILNPF